MDAPAAAAPVVEKKAKKAPAKVRGATQFPATQPPLLLHSAEAKIPRTFCAILFVKEFPRGVRSRGAV